ncbi:MAG: helix-turn-helix domain-containing protein [Deltaproteobacteria bacterium]|nr:helix-turn-helix domain-containing protein [Deltaproteobacteria bacterium]
MAKKKAAQGLRAQKGSSKKANKTSGRQASCTRKVSAFGPSGNSAKALGFPDAVAEVLREVSYRLEIPVKRLEVAVAAARLESEAFGVIETLVQLSQDKTYEDRVEIASKCVSEVLERFASSDEDPLAEVDKTSEKEVLLGRMEAELETRELRRMILASCIGVEDAARIAERTRQRLEELRRKGKILALRVKNRWRYPRWQFDPDYPGGVLPGLGEVLAHLQLSPAGSAAWLTKAFKDLGNHAPIELLRTGQTDDVIELAEEHGHMP